MRRNIGHNELKYYWLDIETKLFASKSLEKMSENKTFRKSNYQEQEKEKSHTSWLSASSSFTLSLFQISIFSRFDRHSEIEVFIFLKMNGTNLESQLYFQFLNSFLLLSNICWKNVPHKTKFIVLSLLRCWRLIQENFY